MIADLCIIGIVILFIALGYRAGFVRSCVNIAAFGISIAVSLVFYPIVSTLLMQTALYNWFVDIVNTGFLADADALNAVPAVIAQIADAGTGVLADGIAGSIAALIVNIIAFILVVIVCRIVLFTLTHVLDLFAKLPVIRQFNRLGGSILGGITGIAVAYLILALSIVALPMDTTGKVAEEINNSKIASQMYNNNILISLIDKGE